jgi:bifunctional non-homologous end joining protein LigD
MAKRDRLADYRSKRSAAATPEPFGATPRAEGRARMFVVQKHWATRKHFDLRLEIGGVLHSWAVPKGVSPDPQDKRLAMEVEDHPLEYGDFEGLIPEGNYGAGAVIVFDRGRWVSHGDPEEGLRDGKLLFDLWGYKLRGRFTLFRTKGGAPNAWLLVKKPDAWTAPAVSVEERSIFSGLTVEELREGREPTREIRERLQKLRAPEREVRPADVEPMLAQTAEAPFSRPGWVFELKYDGYRLIAGRAGSEPVLRYRRGQDVTARFPELATALTRLPYAGLVVDGELVVLDEENKPSFQRLQQRVHLTRPADVARGAIGLPATLFAFDLLACAGHDLRPLPLTERKELLRRILPPVGPIRYSEHWPEHGEAVYEEVSRLGFEGLIAKKADAPYRAGRSSAWLKIKADRTADFAVVGFSPPKGSRAGLGALHLAFHDGKGLVYAGRVGTGFSGEQLRELRETFEPLRRSDPPCTGPLPSPEEAHWVEPRLVAEVRYREWTEAGLLRHPVFLRLREDKSIEECAPPVVVSADTRPELPALDQGTGERTVALSNLDKVFWPEDGYTKGDLIDYYKSVARWMLPYLKDRPLVLTRYPDGIHGKSFFQKDAPAFAPEWLRTETMWSEHAEREIRYFVVDHEEGLAYIANLGAILLHLWSSRIGAVAQPDWCILDLDPKEAPFRNVVTVARALKSLCDEIGLECFVKMSGSSGLHVLLPLGGQCTYDESRQLAELLARVIVSDLPDIATVTRQIGKRGERVYIDCYQNGHGKLLVAPYSVRPLPGAPVSAPLRWSEVDSKLDISRHTIRTMPARLAKLKKDPLLGVLATMPDLPGALERLGRRL